MNRPRLSVVVAATWSAEAIGRTVASIGEAEIIVVSALDRISPGPLPGGALWFSTESGAGVPELRRVGADRATGEVVAFLEDACEVGPGWARALIDAFGDPDVLAATGPVGQGQPASAIDWGVYFAEYAAFAPTHYVSLWSPPPLMGRVRVGSRVRHGRVQSGLVPVRPPNLSLPLKGGGDQNGRRSEEDKALTATPTTRLAGLNFAVRRSALPPAGPIREADLSASLASPRGSIRLAADATVRHVRRYAFGPALADRFRFGRDYGRQRWESGGPVTLRPLGPLAAPAILAVQLGRLCASLVRVPRLVRPLLICLPYVLLLLAAWSVGEASGWGSAGRVARMWKRGLTGRRRARPRDVPTRPL